MHNFTSNDLLLYLLNDLPIEQRPGLEAAMANDPELRLELDELKQGLAEVSSFELQPNPKSMEIVLSELQQQHIGLHIV